MVTKKLVLADAAIPGFGSRQWALAGNIALIFGFAILTAMAAGVKLQIGIVPVTLQTFAVLLSAILLGGKRAAAAQVAYVSAGLAGVPWFSSGGGFQYFFSPTFGYLLGFIVAAFIVGFLAESGWGKRTATLIAALIIGTVCIYSLGLLWLSRFVPLPHLLSIGFYPFIVGDALKILALGVLFPPIRNFPRI